MIVYINNVVCPLLEDSPILVNKRIADIENPEQKTADWTRSFNILGSSKVNELFGHIFEVNKDILNTSTTNFTPDFNPNLKAKVTVLLNNSVVFTGFCQLNNISITEENFIVYSINAYASIGNFINDIRTKFLTDIDLSPFNHNITKANVISSWSATVGDGYVYPMIDYGYDTSYERWVTEYFKPAIYVKEYWDNIFADSGNTYESNFVNSDFFKRLIIPAKNEPPTLDATTIYNNSFLVGRATSVQTLTIGTFASYLTATPLIFNTDTGTLSTYTLHNTSGTDFDTATGKWTCDVAGTYQLAFTISSQLVNNISGFTASTTSTYIGRANIIFLKDVSGTITPMGDQKPIDYTFINSITSGTATTQFTTARFYANVGEVFYIGVCFAKLYDKYNTPYNSDGTNIDFKLAINSAFSLVPSSNISYGQTLPISRTIPDNIRQVDFIMSLAKMFNLYFEEVDYKRYKIEPREDYFNSEIVDWTAKLDTKQPTILTPMGANLNKQFTFSYQDDSDFQNQRYFDSNKRVYGDYIKQVTTDFLTDTKEIKPIFAATPLSCPDTGINNRIISDVRFANSDGTDIKQGQYKLRILYYGGLLACNKWNFRSVQSDAISTGNDKYEYPYAGHLDNPFTPTLDLCFGSPLNVYFNGNIGADGNTTYTDNNLYNKYWSKNITEITDRNSKVLEAYFYLNTYDWVNIDFKKQYFIKDAYYRLLEVIDYDLSGTGLTKCRLIKTDKIAVHVPSSKTLFGGSDTFTAGGKVPEKPIPINQDGKVIRQDTAFGGSGGYQTGGNVTNKGTGSIIPFSAGDSHIFASDNVTVLDSRNFIFNSDSVVSTRPAAIFNGVSLPYKYDQNKNRAYVLEIMNSTPFILLPTLASNEYYQINGFFVQLFQGSDGPDLWTNYTGTNKIQLLVNSLVTAEIAQADWIGEAAGAICKGTITARQEFGYPVKIQVTDEVTGQLNWKVVIFYNIITI